MPPVASPISNRQHSSSSQNYQQTNNQPQQQQIQQSRQQSASQHNAILDLSATIDQQYEWLSTPTGKGVM
jgi:hypothetical protein